MITVPELFNLYDGPSSINPASSLKDIAVPVNPGVMDSPLVFPPRLFIAVKKGSEISVHYGPDHNDFIADPPANNEAVITVMGRVDATEITLLGPRPPSQPIVSWKLDGTGSIAIIGPVVPGNEGFEEEGSDTRLGLGVLLQEVISRSEPDKEWKRPLIGHPLDVPQGCFQIVLPPIFGVPPHIAPTASPRKRGQVPVPATPSTAVVVPPPVIFTQANPGPPGTTYLPDTIPGFEPEMFTAQNIKAIQGHIFGPGGETIHPASLRNVIIPGAIIRAIVRPTALLLTKGLYGSLRVEKLWVDNVDLSTFVNNAPGDTDTTAAAVEEDEDDDKTVDGDVSDDEVEDGLEGAPDSAISGGPVMAVTPVVAAVEITDSQAEEDLGPTGGGNSVLVSNEASGVFQDVDVEMSELPVVAPTKKVRKRAAPTQGPSVGEGSSNKAKKRKG